MCGAPEARRRRTLQGTRSGRHPCDGIAAARTAGYPGPDITSALWFAMAKGANHSKPQPPSPVVAGLRGCCPRCGKGKLFAGFLALAPRCEHCGLDFSFADSADA